MALLGRMLDGAGDLLRIVRFEHSFLQVHHIAVLADVLRPFFFDLAMGEILVEDTAAKVVSGR